MNVITVTTDHHKLESRNRGPLSGHGGADYCLMENFESALYVSVVHVWMKTFENICEIAF